VLDTRVHTSRSVLPSFRNFSAGPDISARASVTIKAPLFVLMFIYAHMGRSYCLLYIALIREGRS
jgi:metallophosphoesterase superfamily enzyme